MKKFARFFLLAVVWLSFLWLCYAQDWDEPSYDYIIWANKCMCGTPLWELFSAFFLIIIWLFLVVISLCSITLYKRYKDRLKNPIILCIPILNLYQLFKISIWKFRFYCIIMFIWCFGYLIYRNRDWCCNFSVELVYPVIIVWLLSICILLVLLIKLIIISRKLDKESPNGQNIK